MHIGLVTPDIQGWHTGNRVTARRWARLLGELGHTASVEPVWRGQDWHALIAVHARRSHASIRAYRAAHPTRPLVVALAGTDLYVDHPQRDADVQDSLRLADWIVALQPRALDRLEPTFAERTRVILQSAIPPSDPPPPRTGSFDVAVVGHMRPVKAPFLTAQAARRLPDDSRLQVLHIGGALVEGLGDQATTEMEENPRYTWMGSLTSEETLCALASCRLMSLTSRSEGGANVLGEAIVCGVPVLATRMDGAVGVLGADYPGLFPVDDVESLADLLLRAERDPAFYDTLRRACDALRPRFAPERERESLRQLVALWNVSDATATPAAS